MHTVHLPFFTLLCRLGQIPNFVHLFSYYHVNILIVFTSQAEEEFMKEALKRLEMTPVMHERKEINLVLSNDSQIDGHDESNFVFTDISTSLNEKVMYEI